MKSNLIRIFLFLVLLAVCPGLALGAPIHSEDRSGTDPYNRENIDPSDPQLLLTVKPPAEPPLSKEEKEKKEKEKSESYIKVIPLPIYATLPNEGSTFGTMPVFLKIHTANERTESIYAPSVSWNPTIRTTGTFRWFHYPNPDPKQNQSFTLTASASSHVNWGSFIMWQSLPFDEGRTTEEYTFRIQRSIFFRFFGIGPFTQNDAESSHTRMRGSLTIRKGINLPYNFNVGFILEGSRDVVQREAVPGLPLSPDIFPGVPGMSGGATILSQSLNIRYDSRSMRDYSEEGLFADFLVGAVEGLANSPDYLRAQVHAKTLVKEGDRATLGARALWRWVSSPQVPFYYQSSLGGSHLLRGFTEDRFIDQGAWTLEMEQRFRLFQTHIYGVTTDWRVDPFIAVGQVFHDPGDLTTKIRITGGVGFRAWVRPNVVGRVDIATAGTGPQFYVEIGYPF